MRRLLIILLTALSTVHTLAAPTSANRARPSASTSPSRVLPQFQQPPSSNGKPRDAPLNLRDPIDPLLVVGEYLSAELGLDESDYFATASHKSSVGVTHVYVAQAINGVRIANAVANFNVGRRGEIISMYHNFVQNDRNRRLQRPTVGVEEAIISFATAAGLPADDTLTVASNGKGGFVVTGATFTIWPIQVRETFYQSELGLLRTWELGVTMPDLCQNVYVDSTSGKVVGVATLTSDFTESYENIAVQAREKRSFGYRTAQNPSKKTELSRRDILPATYSVIPLGRSDPMDNNGFLSRVASPWDLRASPQGWHFENGSQTFEVRGNNVIAQANPNDLDPTKVAGLPRPNSTTLDFEYTYDASKEPADPQNQAASVVNMFYAANIMHDLFYVYGFDEAAGNFQTSNFGKGGLENDAIIANVQDELASNNANFAPSVDGVPGIMRMGIFTSSTPSRDSGFANGIIAHEMAHGLSSRLTGGSGNPNCVQSIESWGMDEGWADAFELFVTLRDEEGRGDSFPSGEWAFNLPNGVREVPVSSNTTVNKLTYANARSRRQLYRIGNVWTTMINEVLWNMVDISGRTPTSHIISSSDASTGNTDLIKIIVLAMKMQPCQPLMIQAKQAMLDAEKLLFDGTYACAIHAGFAKRGLGAKATQEKVNDFSMPVECDSFFPKPTPVPPPVDTCSHSVCTDGPALSPDCSECAANVCAQDIFCCDPDAGWDLICVDEVERYCPYATC